MIFDYLTRWVELCVDNPVLFIPSMIMVMCSALLAALGITVLWLAVELVLGLIAEGMCNVIDKKHKSW